MQVRDRSAPVLTECSGERMTGRVRGEERGGHRGGEVAENDSRPLGLCLAVKGPGQHACSGEFTPLSYSGGSCCVCVRSCPAIAGHAEALAIFPRSSQFFCSLRGQVGFGVSVSAHGGDVGGRLGRLCRCCELSGGCQKTPCYVKSDRATEESLGLVLASWKGTTYSPWSLIQTLEAVRSLAEQRREARADEGQ